jgi:hypothetical protein
VTGADDGTTRKWNVILDLLLGTVKGRGKGHICTGAFTERKDDCMHEAGWKCSTVSHGGRDDQRQTEEKSNQSGSWCLLLHIHSWGTEQHQDQRASCQSYQRLAAALLCRYPVLLVSVVWSSKDKTKFVLRFARISALTAHNSEVGIFLSPLPVAPEIKGLNVSCCH